MAWVERVRMSRIVITEQDIREHLKSGKKSMEIPVGALVTTLAAEIAAAEGLLIQHAKGTSQVESPLPKKALVDSLSSGSIVVFGSDHGGFQYKEVLKKHAETLGFKTLDVGTNSEDPCDYPDFAYGVAIAVSTGKAWRGVMIDGAGIGSCVVANKVPGIRAACCHNEFVARNAREHNDTNVLTLGSRVTGIEVCKGILHVWLESWFSGGRHLARVEKMRDVEKRFLK